LVFQQINNLKLGDGFAGRHTLGWKWGVAPNLEVGWDGAPAHFGSKKNFLLGAGGAPGYPTTFQFKVRFALQKERLSWA